MKLTLTSLKPIQFTICTLLTVNKFFDIPIDNMMGYNIILRFLPVLDPYHKQSKDLLMHMEN